VAYVEAGVEDVCFEDVENGFGADGIAERKKSVAASFWRRRLR
jgi:hypothetical protein